MATLGDVERAAAGHGASVDSRARGFVVIDAPVGRRWVTTDTHSLMVDHDRRSYAAALEDMQGGLEDCPEHGDETCREYDCPAYKGA